MNKIRTIKIMKLCAISFKECWQDEQGRWWAQGGFPGQMTAIGRLFDRMTLVIVRGEPQEGGSPLPDFAEVVPLRPIPGSDTRRKVALLRAFTYYWGRIWREVRAADVVHTPVPGDLSLLGALAALLQRKRLIMRYGGSWEENSQQTTMNRVTKWIMRRFAGGRNVMIATGMQTDPPAPRMHWLFATALARAEIDQFQPDYERGLSRPPCLVTLGRLSPEKGVEVLVRAVGLLKEEGFEPMPVLTILGDGPERGRLEALVDELGLRGQVRFTGMLGREELHRELAGADLAVHPSLTESLSKAWLDAMAHGLPLIATRVGVAGEFFGPPGQVGWLVPAGDPEALADAMRQVLTGEVDWPGMRRRCREKVEGMTLEAWAGRIGRFCAEQWGMRLEKGKLVV
ncbi:MAG TPA: glycosyltransferase [Anaerolineaceae bacterium]|nr:glycosyltransferase [Anaerolineaceae bacterium]